MVLPKRLKKCKNPDCPLPYKKFLPERPFQECCSIRCAIPWGRLKEKIKQNKFNKEARRKWNDQSLKYQIKTTQTAFNSFIRALDYKENCISCDKPKCGHTWDCGHCKTVAARPELRFDPRNAYKQGSSCNRGQAKFRANERTVIKKFEENLVARMGRGMLVYLNSHHEPKKYTCEDLKELRAMFNKERRYIEKHGKPTRDWRALPIAA